MLSGDNSIIKQAGNAKTQTDIAEEKEILEQATVVCMGKSKYGNIEETDLKNELENVADVTLSGSKFKVTFPSERQYIIDKDGNVKEKNPNAMEISELYENGSTYFGWDVINYAETLPEELQDTEWQLFYAGALDGETEERIYLISKGYVKNTVLPTVIKNGVEIEEAKPIAVSGSDYKAYFSTYLSDVTVNDGVILQYNGSEDITNLNVKKLNQKYFDYLNNTVCMNINMKAVAYMLDTITWHKFAESSKKFAEYAIGGPTIELLFTSYNKYKGTSYETLVTSNLGYIISSNNGESYKNEIADMIENDTNTKDNPYSVYNIRNKASGYWIASPTYCNKRNIMYVWGDNGKVSGFQYYASEHLAFRPIICINSKYSLEKTKDSNGNDAFKIVE